MRHLKSFFFLIISTNQFNRGTNIYLKYVKSAIFKEATTVTKSLVKEMTYVKCNS